MLHRVIVSRIIDLTLRKKLFLCLILLVIIPLIITAVFINLKASEAITTKTKETALQTLIQTQFNIDNIIKDTEFLSITMLSNDMLQSLAKFYSQKSYIDMEKTKNNLLFSIQSLISSKSYINSFALSSGDEIIFQYGDQVSQEDTRFQQKALELKGKVYWTSVYKLENRIKDNTNKNVISLIRAVGDIEYYYRSIGTERISINEESICELYKGTNLWKGSSIFIIDNDGTVISSPDKSMLGKNLMTEGYIRKVINEKKGFFGYKVKKEDYTVFFYTVDNVNWHIVQTIPEMEINKQKVLVNTTITISILLCLIFGILFSTIQDRSVIVPLKLLSQEMGKVKKGNFDIHLRVNSKDEIGDLSLMFIDMVNKLKEMIDKVYKSQLKEKEAELKALQAQINPHFLYNTLDSIYWLAYKNKDYMVSEQIEALSNIFKHVLNKGNDVTTIREELEHLQNYMFIQKSRFGDRIELEINVDEKLMYYQTLKLILQPLVENAINHGLECKLGKGKILVIIEKVEEAVHYTVLDDGLGTDEDRIERMLQSDEESQNIFALKNINDRIQLKYGADFGLKLKSKIDKGTRVEVIFPAIRSI